jgi:hypothetical protein
MDTNGHQSPERTRDDFRDFTFEGTAVLAETPSGVGR